MATKIVLWIPVTALLLVVSSWGLFGNYQIPQGLVICAAVVLMVLGATLQNSEETECQKQLLPERY